jgi:hypothetical protein
MGSPPASAQLSIIAAAVLLTPALALLVAIVVAILIDALLDDGIPTLLALVGAGAIGWARLRKLRARNQWYAPIEA